MSTFFDYTTNRLATGSVARAIDLNTIFDAISIAFDKIGVYGTDSGVANAYVVTLPYTPSSYSDRMIVGFKANASNTGASTINVNGLGSKTITRPSGATLQANDIVKDKITILMYNSTSGNFEIISMFGDVRWELAYQMAQSATYLVLNTEAGEDLSVRDVISVNSDDGKAYKFRTFSANFDIAHPETISTSAYTYHSIAIDRLDTTHVVMAYRNDVGNGRVVVGEVANNSVTWGTPVTFNAATTQNINVAALTSSSFVVVYGDVGSGYATAIAGTVSGTTITLGSETVLENVGTNSIDICRLDDTHFFVGYRDQTNLTTDSIVGSVSGTTITLGASVTAFTSNTTPIRVCCLDATRAVIQEGSGHLRIASISDTTITYPTAETDSGAILKRLAYLDSSHFVTADSATDAHAYLYSVSGTTITLEDSAAITTTDGSIQWGWAFNIDGTRVALISTSPAGNLLQVLTCSSTAILSVAKTLMTGMSSAYDPMAGVMIDSSLFSCVSQSNHQIHNINLVFNPPVGLASSSYTAGDTASIFRGLISGFSGLTPGALYKVNGDGTLAADPQESPETDYRIGIAKTATEMIVLL